MCPNNESTPSDDDFFKPTEEETTPEEPAPKELPTEPEEDFSKFSSPNRFIDILKDLFSFKSPKSIILVGGIIAAVVLVVLFLVVFPRISAVDSDKDGVLDKNDLCANTPLGVRVNDKGCTVVSSTPTTGTGSTSSGGTSGGGQAYFAEEEEDGPTVGDGGGGEDDTLQGGATPTGCTDTDDPGKAFKAGAITSSYGYVTNKTGTVTGLFGGQEYTTPDTCVKSNADTHQYDLVDQSSTLLEYYCKDSQNMDGGIYSCPQDKVCLKGACVPSGCVESDNGKNYEVKGTTTLLDLSVTDSCTQGTGTPPIYAAVNETYCEGGAIKSEVHTCIDGDCREGACILAIVQCTANTATCDGDNLRTCNATGNGWAKIESCGGKGCNNGVCLVCANRENKCGSGTDTDYKLTCNATKTGWDKDPSKCQYGCENGECKSAPPCTNECLAEEKGCSGNGFWTCGNYDSDSCLEKSAITSCEYGCDSTKKSCITENVYSTGFPIKVQESAPEGWGRCYEFVMSFDASKIKEFCGLRGKTINPAQPNCYYRNNPQNWHFGGWNGINIARGGEAVSGKGLVAIRCEGVIPCEDSDNGNEQVKFGTCSENGQVVGSDSCSASDLVEYTCSNNKCTTITYGCAPGRICQEGICVPLPSGACTGTAKECVQLTNLNDCFSQLTMDNHGCMWNSISNKCAGAPVIQCSALNSNACSNQIDCSPIGGSQPRGTSNAPSISAPSTPTTTTPSVSIFNTIAKGQSSTTAPEPTVVRASSNIFKMITGGAIFKLVF